MSSRYTPEPSQIDYHADAQTQRVERARKRLDPSDILTRIDDTIASEGDPTKHPLYEMVLFFLDRQVAVNGGQFWDQWKQRVLAAIDTCLDDLLELED